MGRNTVVLKVLWNWGEIYPAKLASVEGVIEAKRVLEKVKDLSDEERETLINLRL